MNVMHVDAAEPGPPTLDRTLQPLGERVKGTIHVGEQGVAAFRGNVNSVEERSGVRNSLVLAIRMPAQSNTAGPERFAIPLRIGDHHYLRMVRQIELAFHHMQWTKPVGERDMLGRVHHDIAKYQKTVIKPCLTDAVEVSLGQV